MFYLYTDVKLYIVLFHYSLLNIDLCNVPYDINLVYRELFDHYPFSSYWALVKITAWYRLGEKPFP